MEITTVIAVTVALLIAWAIFLGLYYRKLEDQNKSLKDKEDYIMIGATGVILIVAWPIALVMVIVGGIMYGIAMLTKKITGRRNGFSTRGQVRRGFGLL